MHETKRPLKVFLCHASADKQKVRELYRYLRRRGIRPWFDEVDLVGGQDWQVEIPKALATSDAIIICLTKNSVDKEGYIQKEIKFALDKALEMPEGRIFLIPVRFEECEVPFSLSRYQWVDLFDEDGYARMMRALKFRAAQLERATVELSKKDIEEEKLALEKAAHEKQEREAAQKAAREKAEQQKLEREAAEKARKEKVEREAIEKAAREKARRDAAKKARRERAERRDAQIAALKETFSRFFNAFTMAIPKAKPLLRIGGILGIIFALIWLGFRAMPQFLSSAPTATASITQRPVTTIAVTNSPPPITKTVEPNATPTKTRTPAPTALPTEITNTRDVQMMLVPAGEFTMGRNANEEFAECQEIYQECQLSWFMNAQPIHQVHLDAFYIDKYEVTNALYRVCENEGVCDPPQASNSSSHSDYYGNTEFDQFPVININWFQAKTYCEWRGARLPTEAEWEKAARGTDERIYPWGEELNEDLANFNYSIGDTIAVGTYENGSPYGVYDMAGNVSEWVEDWYDENYYQGSPTENPPGPVTGDLRGLRGGGWGLVGASVSTSHRYAAPPSEPNLDLGVRCAMDANP